GSRDRAPRTVRLSRAPRLQSRRAATHSRARATRRFSVIADDRSRAPALLLRGSLLSRARTCPRSRVPRRRQSRLARRSTKSRAASRGPRASARAAAPANEGAGTAGRLHKRPPTEGVFVVACAILML